MRGLLSAFALVILLALLLSAAFCQQGCTAASIKDIQLQPLSQRLQARLAPFSHQGQHAQQAQQAPTLQAVGTPPAASPASSHMMQAAANSGLLVDEAGYQAALGEFLTTDRLRVAAYVRSNEFAQRKAGLTAGQLQESPGAPQELGRHSEGTAAQGAQGVQARPGASRSSGGVHGSQGVQGVQEQERQVTSNSGGVHGSHGSQSPSAAPPKAAGGASGRGIVVAAGGRAQLGNAYVMLRVLREVVGSGLPVQASHALCAVQVCKV